MTQAPSQSVHPLAAKRILVTGARGFIGHALLNKLCLQGFAARGHYRNQAQSPTATGIVCDLTDLAAIECAFSAWTPEVIFHLAGIPDGAEGHGHAQRSIASNLVATVTLLEAFGMVAGELFVYGDSSKSYGNCAIPYVTPTLALPNSSYAITKNAGWSFCQLFGRMHGFSAVAVRPTLIYGPGQNFNLITHVFNSVRRGMTKIDLLGGDQTRDPLYIDDALDAYIASANPALDQRIVNIGGGVERTVREIALAVAHAMERNISLRCDSTDMRPTEIVRSYCDNRDAREWLGWEPRTTFTSGLQSTVDYLDSQLGSSN